MLKKVLKFVAWVAGTAFALGAVFVLLLRFAPATGLAVVQTLVPGLEVDAPELSANVLPLRITAPNLRVAGEAFTLEAQDFYAVIHWLNYFSGEPLWEGDVEFVSIALEEQPQPAAASSSQQSTGVDPELVRRGLRTLMRFRVGELVIGDDFRLSLGADKQDGGIVVDGTSRIGTHTLALSGALAEREGVWTGDLKYSWSQETIAATGQFRGDLTLAPGQAMIDFAGSDVTVTDNGELLLGMRSLTGALQWSREEDALVANALGGQLRVDEDMEYAASVTGSVSGLTRRPDLDVALSFGEVDLTVDGLVSEREIDAQISVAARALPHFLQTGPFTESDLLPGKLRTHVQFSDGYLELDDIELASPANEITGFLHTGFEAPFDLNIQLAGQRLYLPLAPSGDAEQVEEDPEDAARGEGPLFPDNPIDFTFLHRGVGRVDINTQVIRLGEATFTDFRLQGKLDDAALTIDDFAAEYEGGGFSGSGALVPYQAKGSEGLEGEAQDGTLEGTQEGVDAELAFELHGVTIEQFGLLPPEELKGGRLRAHVDVSSTGATIRELASQLDGDLLIMVRDAELQNEVVELFGSDVVMELVDKLNPFRKTDPVTRLECAVVHFEVAQGVLNSDNEIFFETGKMKVVGGGEIELPSESLNITLTPHARKGVGVNVGSLVKFMKVGGTIRKPALGVDGKGLLQSGVIASAALATGGLSILAEGLAKRVLDGGSACEAKRFAR